MTFLPLPLPKACVTRYGVVLTPSWLKQTRMYPLQQCYRVNGKAWFGPHPKKPSMIPRRVSRAKCLRKPGVRASRFLPALCVRFLLLRITGLDLLTNVRGEQEIHPRLQRHVKHRLQAIEKAVGLDWATAEVRSEQLLRIVPADARATVLRLWHSDL